MTSYLEIVMEQEVTKRVYKEGDIEHMKSIFSKYYFNDEKDVNLYVMCTMKTRYSALLFSGNINKLFGYKIPVKYGSVFFALGFKSDSELALLRLAYPDMKLASVEYKQCL